MTDMDELYRIDNYMDTYALGHYARVLSALDRRSGNTVAFKVLRPEHLSDEAEDIRWEYQAFGNEASLLSHLSNHPHIVHLYDCGYISSKSQAPVDGEILSFNQDVIGFIRAMPEFARLKWRPYLSLENLPRTNNLFYAMKPNQQNAVRWRLPTEEAIALGLQFANLLQQAHQQNIVYLDHKLEHLYWDGEQLIVIDWNSSRQLEGDVGDDQHYRMDVHNLCVGILYPIITGMSAKKTSLRPQPGNLARS